MLNRSHLISALYHEYQFLCHDSFDADTDATPDEYLAQLQLMSDDELVVESCTDDAYTLDEFLTNWL
mgnify:CR=1 FL=1|jgi:hypothetical protein